MSAELDGRIKTAHVMRRFAPRRRCESVVGGNGRSARWCLDTCLSAALLLVLGFFKNGEGRNCDVPPTPCN